MHTNLYLVYTYIWMCIERFVLKWEWHLYHRLITVGDRSLIRIVQIAKKFFRNLTNTFAIIYINIYLFICVSMYIYYCNGIRQILKEFLSYLHYIYIYIFMYIYYVYIYLYICMSRSRHFSVAIHSHILAAYSAVLWVSKANEFFIIGSHS